MAKHVFPRPISGPTNRAVLVGRPILWGLATAGAAGAQGVLELLSSELGQAMDNKGSTSKSK